MSHETGAGTIEKQEKLPLAQLEKNKLLNFHTCNMTYFRWNN
jgi:hypothetical protein